MKFSLHALARKYGSVVKFVVVGGASSVVHAAISWVFYYHVLCGQTVLSTLAGYSGGWLASYAGNRLWSFRDQAKGSSVAGSAYRFVLGQLAAMCVLLASTWIAQQLVILYFRWYIVTNDLHFTDELAKFAAGASYPPALFLGMAAAACCSFAIMKLYVFRKEAVPNAQPHA